MVGEDSTRPRTSAIEKIGTRQPSSKIDICYKQEGIDPAGLVQQSDKVAAARDLSLFVMCFWHFVRILFVLAVH